MITLFLQIKKKNRIYNIRLLETSSVQKQDVYLNSYIEKMKSYVIKPGTFKTKVTGLILN